MIWQNPWAWLGLASLALPVLIHLLGRGEARRVMFPSLRFLPPSRSLPTRRRRVRDPLLLAVRLGILAAAVSAVARPLLLTRARVDDAGRRLARAIIVDTSASVHRSTRSGESGIAVARREAQRFAEQAQASIAIESATPSRAIAGAIAWLEHQHSRTELVVISDFQNGAIDSVDLAPIPHSSGVRLVRVDVVSSNDEVVARTGDVETAARLAPTATGADVEWTSRPSTTTSRANIALLVGATERAASDAAERAAATLAVRLPFDTSRAIAIVYPTFEGRAELLGASTPLRTAWMADVAVRLRSDSTLVAAASAAVPLSTASVPNASLVVARNRGGSSVVVAREGRVDGRNRLLLMPLVDAGSLTSAALIAAATRAVSSAPPVSELDPSTLGDAVLASWQRVPPATVAQGGDASDGRWLWMLALILLAAETLLRRARRTETVSEIRHDRAA